MIKRLSLIIIVSVILLATSNIYAQDNNNQQTDELQKKINEYQQKLTEIRKEKNTLSSQIDLMDTQIYITGLKIQDTEAKILKTQKEIDTLGNRIEGIDSSLDTITKLLIEKINQSYKQRSLTLLDFLLNSDNIGDFISGIKYLKTTQQTNQKLLIQLQQTKTNFEQQKNQRETKVKDLDQLKTLLEEQKADINQKKLAKQKLLADTQNSETIYQQLLSQAQRQLASFRSFVEASGANTIIAANGLGTGSDGAYYSQRDERWANVTIGYSSENILSVGCLVTSVAMLAKKNGDNLTPANIAQDINRFWGNTAWMRLPWVGVAGKSYVSLNNNEINQELENGNYVIVGVQIDNCYAGGNHFIVLIKKDGDDYIMHDPIYGPDLKFSSHYTTICSAATFK